MTRVVVLIAAAFMVALTADLLAPSAQAAGSAPSFDGSDVAPQHYRVGEAVDASLPHASGGDAPVVYALSGGLPSGLSFSAETVSIVGTPDGQSPSAEYTFTATDADDDSDSLTFTITVAHEDAPRVQRLSVSSTPSADGAYTAGETITVSLEFTESVTVSGTPRLALDVGGGARWADFRSVDAHGAASFDYTVQESDSDLDGVVVKYVSLSGGAIRSVDDGLDASLRLQGLGQTTAAIRPPSEPSSGGPSGQSERGSESSTPPPPEPQVNSLPSFGGETASPLSYQVGEAVDAALPRASGGDPPLAYDLSPALPSGLEFSTTTVSIIGRPTEPSASEDYFLSATDVDGDSVRLSFTVEVVGVAQAQTEGSGDESPGVTGVTITSAPTRGVGSFNSYGASANIDVDVTFSGQVTVTGSPQLALGIGSRIRQAAYRSASGATVSFRYTVIGADRDSDGISIGASALTLNGGSIKVGGVDVDLSLGSHVMGAQSDHTVDGGGASFDGVQSPAYTFTRGVLHSVTLPAAVSASRSCPSLPEGSVCSPYSLSSTPALPGGLSFDAAARTISGTPGATMAETTYTLNAASPQGTDTLQFTLEVISPNPTVSGVTIASTPASNSSYTAGENIDIDVTFDRAVTVTGSPQLALTIGDHTRQAAYQSITGSTLRFRYAVVDEDSDGDGVSIAAGALALNNGTITATTGGIAATLGLGTHAITNDSSHKVNETSPDFGAQTVDSRLYDTYTVITPIVLPEATGGNGPVTYTLTPTTMPQGMTWTASTRTIAGTSTTVTASQTYTWKATDTDGDAATLTFSIEVWAPKGSAVTGVSIHTTDADQNYETGDVLTLKVTYPEKMTITGMPQLTLHIGDKRRKASYDSAAFLSGTMDFILFDYTVQSDDVDRDGVAVPADALVLNGGTIRSKGDGMHAKLDLGTHAIANGGSTSAQMRVNNSVPTFGASSVDSRLYDTNTVITPIVLPEATGGEGSLAYTLTPATMPQGMTWTASTRTIAGTPTTVTASQTYTWKATDSDGDAATLTFSIEVWDPKGPAVTGVSIHTTDADQNYETGDVLTLKVTYPQKMTITGTPELVLLIGDKRRKAPYDAADSASPALRSETEEILLFDYTVQSDDVDGDGVAVPADALVLNGGSIRATSDGMDAKLNLGTHAIANGGTTSAQMRVNNSVPTFGAATVKSKLYDTNTVITPIVLPEATGGNGSLTYTLTPTTMPQGMTWTASTRTIAGTPTAVTASQTYTWKATDSDGDAATLTFSIQVWEPKGPAVMSLGIHTLHIPMNEDDGNYWSGDTIQIVIGYTPKMVVTGTPQLTLHIGDEKRRASYDAAESASLNAILMGDPAHALVFSYVVQSDDWDGDGLAIPADALVLDGGTIVTSGDGMNAQLNLGTYAVVSGDSKSVEMRVADTSPSVPSGVSIPDQKIALNHSASSALLATVNGDAPFTYSVSPALPAGLTVGPNSPIITGQTSAAHSGTHTLSAVDRDGDTATLGTFSLLTAVGPVVDEVAILSRPYANGSYGSGEVIEVAVGFDKAVTTSGLSSSTMSIDIGGTARTASYVSTDSSGRLLYEYTVQALDRDTDGVSVGAGALTLNGATITDSTNGVPAILGLGVHDITNDLAHEVNGSVTTPMAVEAVDIVSSPASSDGYDVGEVIKAKVTFSKPATVTGTPRLTLTVGTLDRFASYRSADSSGDGVVFGYTVATQDKDANGISIGASALSLNLGTIRDGGGANAALGLGTLAVSNSSSHKVYTPPRVTGVSIVSNPGVNGTYDSGEAILLQLSFSEATTAFGNPQVALTIGANTRQAVYYTDPNLLRPFYRYVVVEGDFDGDGISVGADALSLPDGVRLFAAFDNESAVLSLGSHAFTDDSAHTVRDSMPMFGNLEPQHYTAGTAVDFALPTPTGGDAPLSYTLSPSALPSGLTHTTSPSHKITGTPNASAVGAASSYTWTVTDNDGDSAQVPLTITVAAANAPKIVDVFFRSTPTVGDTYDANPRNEVVVEVKFDQQVAVTGTPQLALDIGMDTALVDYVQHGGANIFRPSAYYLRFIYRVQARDKDDDGISIDTGALTLNGGTIRSRGSETGDSPAGTDAALGLGTHAIVNDASHKVDGGANNPPAVSSITFLDTRRTQSDTYTTGERMDIAVSFTEDVVLTGSPTLALRIGNQTRNASFSHVVRATPTSPYRTIRFAYVVQASDYDADGISLVDTLDSEGNVTAYALNLNGGTLRDPNGVDALLALGARAVTNLSTHKVSTPPTIRSVSVISTPNQDGTYSWASHITIAIDYDQPVVFTPSTAPGATGMRLALEIDSGNRDILPSYSHTSGSRIAFTHDVQSSDLDATGVSISANALKLNGGTLRDSGGQDAPIDLTGFTFMNKSDAKLDGTKARLWPNFGADRTTVTNPVARTPSTITFTSPGGDTPLTWSIAPTLPSGLAMDSATGVISGTPSQETPLQEYTVTVEDNTGVPASGVGNYDFDNGDTDTLKFNMRVTGPRPVVTGVAFISSPQQGETYAASENVVVGVTFATDITEDILVEGTPQLALKIGSNTRQADYYQTQQGTNTLYFSYTIQSSDVDADGISIEAGALTIGEQSTIRSARGHNAVTSLGLYPIANASEHKVNGGISRAPTVTGVHVTSSPAREDTYNRGEEIEVRVEFSQAVGVTGSPTLGMLIGSNTRQATYARVGLNARYHYFRYIVQEADVDADGFYTSTNALTVPSGAQVRNMGGQDAQSGILSASVRLSEDNIDGGVNRAAFVQEVRITSQPARGETYKLGETITARVRFSKPVTVTGTPSLAMTIGANTRHADYTKSIRAQPTVNISQPYAYWLEFSYTVQGGDYDADGISIKEVHVTQVRGLPVSPSWVSPLTLDGGEAIVGTGDGGTAANLHIRIEETIRRRISGGRRGGRTVEETTVTDHSLENQASHKVDGRQPTVTSFEFVGQPRNITRCNDPVLPRSTHRVCDQPGRRDPGGYVEGDTITVRVTFSEPVVRSVGSRASVALTMDSGTVSTSSSTIPLRATQLLLYYTVGTNDSDANGISVSQNALSVSGGSIRSRATGNPAVLTLPSALGNQPYQTVLRVPPSPARISGTGFIAFLGIGGLPYADSTFDAGEYIYPNVTFNRAVHVSGSPQLSITIGDNTRTATYISGNGSSYLTFRYLVQSSDRDEDGISLPANALSLNGGRITTVGNGLAADITSSATSNDSLRKVNGAQNVAPSVRNVVIRSTPVVGNTYGTDEQIRVYVYFHKRIVVTGSPQLALRLGTETVQASVLQKDDLSIVFQYTVDTADRDLDGLSIEAGALGLNSGTIRSRSGVNANLGLGARAVTNDGNHRVDGRIKNIPTFGSTVVSAKSWREDTAVSDTLPAAEGGQGSLTYSLSPALPRGLSFNNSTRAISGTPRVAAARSTYTLTARDSQGSRATLDFYITVAANPAPDFGSQTITDKTWTEDTQITSFTLPLATGGDGTLTYSLSPGLPMGVSRHATTRVVSGTPTGSMMRTEYTWTATDTDGDTASLTFDITVSSPTPDLMPTFGPNMISNKSWMEDEQIMSFTLPLATGGDGTLSYSLSPALPSGVSRHATTRVVSGTPQDAKSSTRYTWSATDTDGDTVSLQFTITVIADTSPSFSGEIDHKYWIRGNQITSFTLPLATGGNGALSYTLSPALPTGVTRDLTTRVVSGTPSESAANTEYTWSATDADGDKASLTFDIEVDAVPSFGSQTIDNQSWTDGLAITSFTLPTATGGDGSLTYTLSPALPSGVSRHATTRVVSGTPGAGMARTEYTWTATDSDGDKVSLTFDIEVDSLPSFGTQTIPDQVWTKGKDITPLTFPLATGGDGTLTYTLDPGSPNSMTWTSSNRLTGAPSYTMSRMRFVWEVYDEDNDSDELEFYVTIQEPAPELTFGSQSIDDQSWMQGKAIDSFTLPAASGGSGSLTYALSPALPGGVTRNLTSREVSGTPNAGMASKEYTWKATDGDGNEVSLTFDIEVDAVPTFGSQTIDDQSWTQGQSISSFTLPEATGGDGVLSYTLSPALPSGVTRDSSTRVVSGTPGGGMSNTEYTWSATDADGDKVSLTFDIEVDAVPTFGSQTIDDRSWTQGQSITSFTLPAATGGDGALSYSLSPALPGGVSRHATTRVVSGTPGGGMSSTEYTWTATDADGDKVSLTFDIVVDAVPTFGSHSIGDKSWTQGESISSFTLPAATGGDGALSYSLSPALPGGVSRHATTRVVSGTPDAGMSSTEYTWKAEDADGDEVSLTFDIEVDAVPTFGSQTIDDRSWTQGQSISSFTLPAATGGDGALSYSLSPALPGGVSRHATTRVVSGTPDAGKSSTEYTWTATDADGDKVSLKFDIEIDAVPTFGSQTIDDRSWTQGESISSFTLPAATGGDGSLTYTLSPALPGGVVRDLTTRVVSGTPGEGKSRTEYTWSATDSDGDKVSLTFDIEVDAVPTFGSQTIGDKSWTQGQLITSFTLPAATGGDGSLTYTLGPGLPSGVSRHATTRVVSGTPDAGKSRTEYTWTATDADGDEVELTFDIVVDAVPTFGSHSIGDKSWTQGQTISSFTLPAATGGDGVLSYALSPALPGGVSRHATTRVVSGTPDAGKSRTEYTWTATDADGDEVELTFDIVVDAVPTFGSHSIGDKSWTQGQTISSFTLPAATGGDGVLSYTLSPALPGGVSRHATTRVVSGTPDAGKSRTEYTWTATDADGDAVELTFDIEVDAVPTFGSQTIDDQSWKQGESITSFTLPAATGGDGALSYSLSPALPSGVSRHATTRVVSGTPDAGMSSTEYTWKAEDADGDAVELKFDIVVDGVPTFGSQTIDDRSWTQGQSITVFTLPAATGGDGALSYSLSPALPGGVSRHATTRVVSGTPGGGMASTEYTWTATDADGDEVSLKFDIEIDAVPTFGSQTIDDRSWTQGESISSFTLPAATGGDGVLSYALSPALPGGVSRHATTRVVSGTPDAGKSRTEYTWTATDADGDEVELTFDIVVDAVPTFGSHSIGDKSWTQGQTISSFTLPAATGGDGVLSYTLSPALPGGVSRHATTRVVSGTPDAGKSRTEYTWTATDADGDAVELTFDIEVDAVPTFGSQTIDDQSWKQGESISSFTLPAATGGDGVLSYSLSPALPGGVSRHATTRVVSGTPGGGMSSTEYMWTATDADGDAVELTFDIVVDAVPTFGSHSIGDRSWTQGQSITVFTLPAATGGDGVLSYTLSPAMPSGVVRDLTTRLVSGTPGGGMASTEYTWTATDADGDKVSLKFDIEVDAVPTFGVQTIDDRSWTQGQSITVFTLPAATGGDGSLTYTLSPALPGGVSRHATTRVVSGTPDAGKSSTEYTWTATDSDGDKVSLKFDIEVDAVPTFGVQTIDDRSWTQGQSITVFTLPAATGGDGSLTYTLSPALPGGVSRHATTRVVSGTPGGGMASTEYTWTATDADGDEVSLTFDIVVDGVPTFGSHLIGDKSWTQGESISSFTLPAATGGDGVLSYSLSPALPGGVSRHATTRVVSGTPGAGMSSTEYTWTATDEDGDKVSLKFDIEIDAVPTFGSQTIGDRSWTQGESISSFTLPVATGGDGSLTYTLSPGLPTGVSRHATTRIVSGTPGGGMSSTEYTWTATDADGDAAELTFDIVVDGVPTFGSQTIGDKSWTEGQLITSFTLPAATGGDGVLSYTLSPALPSGVSRHATTRVVSGTPGGGMANTEYTWTATDADGDEVSLTFDIVVDAVPTFGSHSIGDKSWTQGQSISSFTLPAATGGDGVLSYTLSPALPGGVSRHATTRVVSGTPGGGMSSREYTWTATDADGDKVSLKFDIEVDAVPTFGVQTIDDRSWTQGQSITVFTLPAATGGDGSLTYTLSPALPGGVSRHATTRVVSGTPDAGKSSTEYTWTATDSDGDKVSLKFDIEVDAVPTFGVQTIDDRSWTQGQSITVFTLPAATGGDGSLTYTLSPALPGGVSRHATTRVVSGTPGGGMASTEYTWTATDADGDEVSLTFDIVVDGVPTFGSHLIGDKSWTQGESISSFTLPAATGGDGVLSYSLSPALPGGVSRHATTRVVSGTPGAGMSSTEYTWTATDEDGDKVSLKFDIEIDAVPTLDRRR